VIDDGVVVVRENRIAAVGPAASVTIPAGAHVVDVAGRTVIPGLVDVHAHMGYLALDINPRHPWEYHANLAYGVTTTYDPSASTQFVFSSSELVEAGEVVGPRVLSTGFILYGARNPNRARINSLDDARGHLRRLRAEGAFGVKSYNQLRRDARQWVIQAAREEGMHVYPEGGSMLQQNLSMMVDGHTGIEHAIPVAPLYRDGVTRAAESQHDVSAERVAELTRVLEEAPEFDPQAGSYDQAYEEQVAGIWETEQYWNTETYGASHEHRR
jgi:hypothetical protein